VAIVQRWLLTQVWLYVTNATQVNPYLFLFTDFSKLLICGGYYKSGQISDTCEVIDLDSTSTTCKDPPNFPATVNVAIGGIGFKENPIICSGFQNTFYSNRCFSLEINELS
jgi:hypothetical protein